MFGTLGNIIHPSLRNSRDNNIENVKNQLVPVVVNGYPRIFVRYSLCFLTIENTFRRACIVFSESKYFKNLVLLAILLNTLFFALADYQTVNEKGELETDGSTINLFLESSDDVFIAIFALEAVLKIIAYGFYAKKYAYLNNPWNHFDLFVLLTGVTSYFVKSNVTAIRCEVYTMIVEIQY